MEFARQGFFEFLAVSDLAPRKFPFQWRRIFAAALTNKQPPVCALDDRCYNRSHAAQSTTLRSNSCHTTWHGSSPFFVPSFEDRLSIMHSAFLKKKECRMRFIMVLTAVLCALSVRA